MRVILDIDDKIFEDMQGYASTHNTDVNIVLEDLFNTYIQEPANIIDEIGMDELNDFAHLLHEYLNESILDMKVLIGTSEEYEDDSAMIEVYKMLLQEHINSPRVITDLYKTFINNHHSR